VTLVVDVVGGGGVQLSRLPKKLTIPGRLAM